MVVASSTARGVESKTLYLDAPTLHEDITSSLSYLEDPENALTASDLALGGADVRFLPLEEARTTSRHSRKTHWLRLQIANRSSPQAVWYVYLSSSTLTESRFYEFSGLDLVATHPQAHQSGGVTEQHDRRQPYTRLTLPQGESRTLYIKLRSNWVLDVHTMIADQRSFDEYGLADSVFFGLYFGCLLVLLLYNLCLYVALEDKLYLYYVVFATALVTNTFAVTGFVNVFAPAALAPTLSYVLSTRSIGLLAALLYSQHFLRMSTHAPRLNHYARFFAWGMLVTSLLSPSTDAHLAWLDDLWTLLTSVLIIAAGSIAVRKGDRPVRIYLVAWAALLAAVALWSINNAYSFTNNYLVLNAPLLGSMMEMILMSFALGQRYSALREEAHHTALERVERERLSDLVRILCHDFANPLAVVHATAGLAIKRLPPEATEAAKRWERVQRASTILVGMIEQIRSDEAERAGKTSRHVQAVNLDEVFDEVAFVFADRLKAKNLSLVCQCLADAGPLFVQADKLALSTNVLNNLVSNAIKFSHPGGKIEITAEAEGAYVCLSVRDHGVGMDQELVARLFNPQAATSRPGTNAESGTGFGMQLAKNMVESFAGSLSVHSITAAMDPQGHGTCIEIRLPQAQAPGTPEALPPVKSSVG